MASLCRPASRLLPLTVLFFAACGDDPPAGGNGGTDADVQFCDESTPCTGGKICVSGVCEAGSDGGPGSDGGFLPGARMQVCTAEGCIEPYLINFGGSRVGARTDETLTIRSVGEEPLEIRNLGILGTQTELSADPTGELNITLQPNEDLAVRVSHVAIDGVADNEQLQIVTNALQSVVLVQLRTEYKGVPSLFVGQDPELSTGETITLDFGNVRAGAAETRTLYLKNKDRIIDGSILSLDEVRLDPATSTNFRLTTDATTPVYLNQFNSLCAQDPDCVNSGDTCNTTLSVCATAGGPLRDILTANIEFIGTNPGMIEESFIVLSNDGGQGTQTRTVNIRANVTFSSLDVTPDPVAFVEGFIGFSTRQTVSVSNQGTAILTIDDIALSSTAAFALDMRGVTFPIVVNAGGSTNFDVIYAPAAVGTDNALLTIESDDAASPTTMVSVTGNALIAPELELTQTSIQFGDAHIQVGIQPSASVQVTARNLGGSDLRVTSLARSSTTSSNYSVDPTSIAAIPPGGSSIFNVRYSPLTPSYPNYENGAIEVVTNDPRHQPHSTIGVRGRGVNPNALVLLPPPFTTQINYNTLSTNPNSSLGAIFYAQQLDASVTIVNSGFGPLTISSIAFNGDARGAFSIVNGPTPPLVIAQSQNVVLNVRYAAPGAGTDGATLNILTNDLDLPGGLAIVTLIGNTQLCPSRPNTAGLADAAGVCSYACNNGWIDRNNDRNVAIGQSSNGCEYACTFQSMIDLPDDAFVDANCDGIDGDPALAVFVAPPPLGNGGNPGTLAAPLATIQSAITAAQGTGRAVYVSDGSYTGPLTVIAGVSVYGGYVAGQNWIRDINARSTINGQNGRGLIAININTPTVIDRLEVIAGAAPAAAADSPGNNSIAVEIRTSNANLQIRNSRIVAGLGSNGAIGGNGGPGAAGGVGIAGQTGGDGSSSGGGGGAGGASSCGLFGGGGGPGGYDEGSGVNGGTGNFGTLGGNGGAGGGCGNDGANGNGGNSGTSGGAGTDGFGGNGSGVILGSNWVGSRGTGGGTGVGGNAGGGGGGGGGGSDRRSGIPCFCANCNNSDRGGGGGGGGGGGCGGDGGQSGYGGGGSFGLFVASASPVLANNVITAGNGGAGGRGGNFGNGGGGGAGAAGGNGPDDGGDGAYGGNGGTGGRGGSGGGGGGGVSYCVYMFFSGGTTRSNNACTQGSGGGGGQGGLFNTPFGDGAAGVAGNEFP